jgi:hypothetical protein
MRRPRILSTVPIVAFLLTAATANPQGVITTVAGTTWTFPATPLPAVNAPLGSTAGVAVDARGNVYIADTGNNMVMRVAPDGTLIVVAGNGTPGFSGDGESAMSASLRAPYGVAIDSTGDLYIADFENSRIRRVSGGTISTFAGNGAYKFSGDGGPATSASLAAPEGVAVDSADNLTSRIPIMIVFARSSLRRFLSQPRPRI